MPLLAKWKTLYEIDMTSVKKFLELHSSSTPSKWRESAEWRRANRGWLKKSRQIAMAVMDGMEAMGISQKDLAGKMNVSPECIGSILKGNHRFTQDEASKLGNIFNVRPK